MNKKLTKEELLLKAKEINKNKKENKNLKIYAVFINILNRLYYKKYLGDIYIEVNFIII